VTTVPCGPTRGDLIVQNYEDTIKGFLNKQENVLITYPQDAPEDLIKALSEAIEIYEVLLQAILDVQHNNPIYTKRKDIADSIYLVQRGLELVNSYLFLLCSDHYPAPLFLLRSILNHFWFSYCSLANYSPESTTKKFYDEYESDKPYMSKFEIKMNTLARIIGRNDYDKRNNIVTWLNSILHGSFEAASIWKKTDQDYFVRPSPVRLSPDYVQRNYVPALIYIRGMLEFCRTVMSANYVLKKPTAIFEGLFDPQHMKIGNAAVYAYFLAQVQDIELGLDSLPCNL
jgi:hypothetical protein